MPLIYTGVVDILERTGHTVVDLVAVAVTAVLEVRVEHVGGAVHVDLDPSVAAAAVIRADVTLNKVCIIAEQLCHFLECGCHDVAVTLVIVKAEVCVPFGMNAVAGDLRAERVIRKCVCGPVVGRAQIPADRIEDGFCFLFGFGERGGIGGLLFLDAVDVAGGDGDILGIEVTLCAIGKFYFIPGVGGFRDRDSGVIADNADNAVICACTLAQVDVCRGLGADGAVCRGLGRRGRCGSGSNLDVLCVNVARGAVSKADGVPLGSCLYPLR